MRALSADAALQHGLNPSANIIDELHAHRDGALYTALTTGTLAREQPFTLWITTAGARRLVPRRDVRGHGDRAGELEDRGTLRIYRDRVNGTLIWWYGAPDDADIEDPAVWRAANPASWLQDGKELGQEYARLGPAVRSPNGARTTSTSSSARSRAGCPTRTGAPVPATCACGPTSRCTPACGSPMTTAPRPWQPPSARASASSSRCARSRHPRASTSRAAAIERHLRDLHARYPARVIAEVTVRAGRTVRRARPGPEVVCHGAFFEPSRQRLAGEGLVMLDVPSTPERTGPAAAALMQLVTAGTLTHDGDPETARQMSRVTARAVPKGWALASASG